MALPESGPISMSMVNTELGYSATAVITLNDAAVRTLFGKSSGAIALSDGYGKSNGPVGVIDTIGYKQAGRYFDGLGAVGSYTAASDELFCTYASGTSCLCCGQPDPYSCNSCNFYTYSSTPISSSFKASSTGGYYDPSTNSGFLDFTAFSNCNDLTTYISGECATCSPLLQTGNSRQLGIKKDGTLWAWGSADYATSDGAGSISPVIIGFNIAGNNQWRSVQTSYNDSMAIKADGTLWAWGYNDYGQLGDGTKTPRNAPVQIASGSYWRSISMGWLTGNALPTIHAIKTDGTLWGWGQNGYGQLGNNSTAIMSTPTQIGSSSDWATISHGYGNTFGIKTDGTLWAWGLNFYFMLGDGTQTYRCTPTQIGSATNWKSVVGSVVYPGPTIATKTDGTLWTWGEVEYGLATNGSKVSPIQIGSSTINSLVPERFPKRFKHNGITGIPVVTTNGNLILYTSTSGSNFTTIYSGSGASKLFVMGDDTCGNGAFLMKNIVAIPSASASVSIVYGTQKAIFGYGFIPYTGYVSMTNLVSNNGVVASDTTGVGTAKGSRAAASYGLDKALFGFGETNTAVTNKVSNTGVVATDTTGVGTARYALAAAGYGTNKAIFGYGLQYGYVSMTNLVNNTGVVSTDTTGVGTSRFYLSAAGYGYNKAIFGYGNNGSRLSMTNLVSDTGVVSTDTTGVGTVRWILAAASYGNDKAIFGYGAATSFASMTNLVSNTGVVATDTTGVGTARSGLAAAGYGLDKAIFGYGNDVNSQSVTNLVSNTGVVANNTSGVGTARVYISAAGYST